MSSLFLLFLWLFHQRIVSSFVLLQPPYHCNNHCNHLLLTKDNNNDYAILAYVELDEMWNKAAMMGQDAIETTTNFLKDRALDCKQKVLSRNFGIKEEEATNSQELKNATEDSEHDFILPIVMEKEFETAYRIAAGEAEIGLMNAIHNEEEIFLERINEIVSDYNQDLTNNNDDDDGLTEEDVFSATRQYIQRSATVNELFEIAMERAELAYKVEIIQAEETRSEESAFYEKHGRYMQATSRDDLMSLTVLQLKQRLRNQGKKVSGKKQELIDRLLSD